MEKHVQVMSRKVERNLIILDNTAKAPQKFTLFQVSSTASEHPLGHTFPPTLVYLEEGFIYFVSYWQLILKLLIK